jgi:glycosyltransferase involved in cell wall biosynthesis
MTKSRKILVLIDWTPAADWALFSELNGHFHSVAVQVTQVPSGFNHTIEKILFLWKGYVISTVRAFLNNRDADVVYAWQPVLGLFYAFLSRIFKRRKTRIAVSHLIVPQRSGFANKLKMFFIKFCLQRVDLVIVSSTVEARKFAQFFKIPNAKICFNPLGIEPVDIAPTQGAYIFSGGRSNRDYRTLCEAVEGLEVSVKIIAQKYNLEYVDVPGNVAVQYGVFGEEFDRGVAEAKMVIIPLDRPDESSGQLVLLNAMYFGKAVIITDSEAVRDYVDDQQSALLTAPHDASALRSAITRLLHDDSLRRLLGENARRKVLDQFMFAKTMKQLVARLSTI